VPQFKRRMRIQRDRKLEVATQGELALRVARGRRCLEDGKGAARH